MFKKLSLTILITMLILSTTIVGFAEGSDLQLRVASNSVLLGEDIEIEIIVTNVVDLAGAEIILNYDSSKMEFKSKTVNLDTNTYIDLQNHGSALGDSDGNTKLIFGLKKNSDLLSSSGSLEISLGTITYTALEAGDAEFTINNVSKIVKYDGVGGYIYETINLPLSPTTINIYIKGSIAGIVTLDDSFDAQGSTVTLLKDAVEIQTTTVNAEGSYAFTGLDDGLYTVKISMKGYLDGEGTATVAGGSDETLDITLNRVVEDVDRNGSIGLEDLVEVGNLFKLNKGETGFKEDSDVNNDDTIDLLDLIYITRKIQ